MPTPAPTTRCCHTRYFAAPGRIYALGAYTFRITPDQPKQIDESGHTFCRLTRILLRRVLSDTV